MAAAQLRDAEAREAAVARVACVAVVEVATARAAEAARYGGGTGGSRGRHPVVSGGELTARGGRGDARNVATRRDGVEAHGAG